MQSVQQGKIKPIGGMCLAIKMLYSYNLQVLGIYNQLAKYGHNDRIVFTERRSNFLHKIIKLKQVQYFISKNQPGLQSSDPLKSSPGSHSLLVSDSVGIMSDQLPTCFVSLGKIQSNYSHMRVAPLQYSLSKRKYKFN